MRTHEEVQTEYARVATMLGDATYRITTLKEDIRKMERKMRQLNVEAQGIANAKANADKEASNGTETTKQANA